MTLKELKDKLAALSGQATAKRAEIKDGMAAADVARIEGEHGAIAAQIETLRSEIATAEAAELAARAATANPPAPVNPAAPAQTVDADAIRAEAQRAERERGATITALATRANVERAFIDQHIAAGTTVEAFRGALLDKLAEVSNRTQSNSQVAITQDETVTRRAAVVEYLVARSQARPVPEASARFRGMRLIDLAREAIEWSGGSTRGLTPTEIATRALHSTSDFPNILAAVANKMLLAAYQAAPQTFRLWTRRISLSDFKTLNMLRLGQNPQLKKVNEHGQFKRGTIAEGKETIALSTYGIVVGITRQVIVNDDLGAFTDVPGRFGQSAANLESDLVYGKLLANAVLNTDSKAVFHAGHNNFVATGGAAPSITTISAGRVAMAKQKDLDNVTILNVSPRILLVPPELETTAAQLTAPLNAVQTSNVVPEYIRTLQPISEPRLSVGISNADIGVSVDGSATAWYLAAGSGVVDTIVWATLDGQDGPFTETRVGFDVDGVEIKCRHDFGAASADYRGLYKNVGA